MEKTLRVRTIEADGSSPRALEAAGVRDAAMVIAVADVDEVNIVACAIAHQYGVATKIARVRDIELGEHPILAGGKVLGIDLLINPTQVVADEILRVIKTTGAAEVADFADGRVQLLGVKVGAQAPLVNRRLRDLRSVQASAPFRVVGIARGERLIVPTDDTALAAEDHVYVVSRRDVIPDILVLMGRTAAATRQVFIIGGGRIGLEVARALEADEIAVTVLERSRSRYDELTRELTRARVVQGDGTDVKLLVDEDIGSADAIVTLTDDDPTNLLAGLLGKRHGAKKAVALFKRQDLIPLVGSLGIDAAISPRLLTASVILKYVRGEAGRLGVRASGERGGDAGGGGAAGHAGRGPVDRGAGPTGRRAGRRGGPRRSDAHDGARARPGGGRPRDPARVAASPPDRGAPLRTVGAARPGARRRTRGAGGGVSGPPTIASQSIGGPPPSASPSFAPSFFLSAFASRLAFRACSLRHFSPL